MLSSLMTRRVRKCMCFGSWYSAKLKLKRESSQPWSAWPRSLDLRRVMVMGVDTMATPDWKQRRRVTPPCYFPLTKEGCSGV